MGILLFPLHVPLALIACSLLCEPRWLPLAPIVVAALIQLLKPSSSAMQLPAARRACLACLVALRVLPESQSCGADDVFQALAQHCTGDEWRLDGQVEGVRV